MPNNEACWTVVEDGSKPRNVLNTWLEDKIIQAVKQVWEMEAALFEAAQPFTAAMKQDRENDEWRQPCKSDE